MDLINIPSNPVPADAVSGKFDGYDGKPIRYAYWKATSAENKGTICLFSGRTEFVEKYFEVITELRTRGFAVATMDWRGQGGSVRLLDNAKKGHIEKFEDFLADAEIFMNKIVQPNCPAPYTAIGHSMGGHLLLRLSASDNCQFERAILCSPMFGFAKETTPISLSGLKKLSGFLKFIGRGKSFAPGGSEQPWDKKPFAENKVSSDEKRYKRAQDILAAAPELGLGDPTVSWLNASCKSILQVTPAFTSKIKIPMLILASGDDGIVDSEATEKLAGQIETATFRLIPDARHELMMENDAIRQQFWESFDAFTSENKEVPLTA